MADQAVVPATTTSVKPGWQTSEFWLNTLAMIVSILYTAGVIPAGTIMDKGLGVAATALLALGYNVSRSIVKSNS